MQSHHLLPVDDAQAKRGLIQRLDSQRVEERRGRGQFDHILHFVIEEETHKPQ